MFERYLHHVRTELPAADEAAAGARVRLAEKFPRTTLRRMTHLGLLLGSVLEEAGLGQDDALVYASSYAETRALEDFLQSFPAASPLLFQTSIHPGGVQQVLIGRQQPIARLWPLAGRKRLVEHALMTALLEPAPRVALAGGEERGSWLLDQGVASEQAFAFGLVLTSDQAGAAGRVAFVADGGAEEACPTLENFTAALATRTPLQWTGGGGRWTLDWS
jgi:hypothetical protein